MPIKLYHKFKKSKGLIRYFFLTYIDKLISFATPLFFLFIINDKEMYSYVEVAFSYATLAMIVVEFGISSYLYFGYKNSSEKALFVQNAQLFFRFLLALYVCISLVVLIGLNYIDKDLFVLFLIVIIRTLFMLYLNFNSNIYRLNDNPSGIYLISIAINLASFVFVVLASFLSLPNKIVYFFLPPLILLLIVFGKFVFKDYNLFRFKPFWLFIKKAFSFSWPITINILAMSYMNNYAKIYAFDHLSQQEMVQISYIMRIGLIVQLTHSSFSSYFSKALFMDVRQKLNVKIFKQYSSVILFSTFLVFIIIVVTNYFFSNLIQIPFTWSTFLFVFYIILWCYIGYLELYFGVMNANRRILIYSLISAATYTVLLNISKDVNVLKLASYMVISMALNLILVLIGLYKLEVLTFNFLKGIKRKK